MFTQIPTLSTKQQANGNTRPSPRWSLTTTYGDWSVELEIEHQLGIPATEAAENAKLFIWTEGDCYEVIPTDELQRRDNIAKEHDDVYDTTHIHVVPNRHGLLDVKTALLERWNALGFIFRPSVLC